MLTDDQKSDIRDFIIDTLLNYQRVIRLGSGQIESANFVTGVSGWQLNAQGNVEANNGTFRGTISITDPTLLSMILTGGTAAEMYFYAKNSTYSPADPIVGKVQVLGSGNNYSMLIYGHESTIIQRAFFDGMSWNVVNVATFDSNGIALSGPSGNFISRDGSLGITGTMTTSSLVGKTLTFKNGIITGFA